MTFQARSRLRLKLSIMMLTLIQRGCLPWTSPPSARKRKQVTKRLYYKEENTTLPGSSHISTKPFLNETGNEFLNGDDVSFEFEGNDNPRTEEFLLTRRRHGQQHSSLDLTASAQRAISQIHALMDLFETSNSISMNIVADALDGVIQKILQDKDHLSNDDILDQVLALLLRAVRLQITLHANKAFNSLWIMTRQKYENNALAYMDRAAKLILIWRNSTTDTCAPNEQCVEDLFGFAATNSMSMTSELWNIYQSLPRNGGEETLIRNIQRDTFQILSVSTPNSWSEHLFNLLLDLERQNQANNDTLYVLHDEELKACLLLSSQSGKSKQATWLFRKLCARQETSSKYSSLPCTTERRHLWRLLLEAYAKSEETGSLAYMEQLIRTIPETQHRELYNIVIRARSRRRTPGSGLRAATFLDEMEQLADSVNIKHNGGDTDVENAIRPDMESVYHAVMAYLDETPPSFHNVQDAESLVRRFVENNAYNLKSGSRDWPIFEKLLQGYVSSSVRDIIDPATRAPFRSIKAGEDLFRFYMNQEGVARGESPKSGHLHCMLQLLNHHPTKRNAEKSVEFFRWWFDKKILAKEKKEEYYPMLQILLDTLSKSRQPGYGDFAEQVLLESQRKNGTKPSPFLWNQMLQIVLRCHEHDQNKDLSQELFDLYNSTL